MRNIQEYPITTDEIINTLTKLIDSYIKSNVIDLYDKNAIDEANLSEEVMILQEAIRRIEIQCPSCI